MERQRYWRSKRYGERRQNKESERLGGRILKKERVREGCGGAWRRRRWWW